MLEPCKLQELNSEIFKVVDLNLVPADKAVEPDDLFEITENSSLCFIGSNFNVSILIDYSLSLKTAEAKVLASIAFETAVKCVRGIVEPYLIKNSITGEEHLITPTVNASVIAVGRHRVPIRTLIHRHAVTVDSVMDLAEVVYLQVIQYENENEYFPKSEFGPRESVSMLDIGVLSLQLFPTDALPLILVVTDGVSQDSLLISEESNRTIISSFCKVGVIQTGSGSGFTPTVSLGHLPNNEDLNFLAERTDGIFLYADDCPYIFDDTKNDFKPNLYHMWFTRKDIKFRFEDFKSFPPGVKPREIDQGRSRFVNTTTDMPHETTSKELSFPWLIDSHSPFVAEILCSYRTYKIPLMRFDVIWQARINEGFILYKLKKSKPSSKNTCKVEITLTQSLALNVKILYTLKFSINLNDKVDFSLPRSIKVDINVLAHHSFAILFINVHNFDAKTDALNGALYEKLVKLHARLKSIAEADETLQILSQFNSPSAIFLANQFSTSPAIVNNFSGNKSIDIVDLPNNYWQFLSQAVLLKPYLLFKDRLNLLLRSTSTQSNLGARAAKSFKPSVNDSPRSRYQVATIYLSRFLTSWASFSLSKTTYACWITQPDSPSPTGLCLLHLNWETESLMTLDFLFFSTTLQERCDIVKSFRENLSIVEHVNRHTPDKPIRPIYLCKHKVEMFLLFYTPEDSSTNLYPTSIDQLFKPNHSIARQYLDHETYVWFADITTSDEAAMSSLVESSFVKLYNSRIADGFLRSSESSGSVTFYKEITLGVEEKEATIQYILLYDPETCFLCTEIWVDPIRIDNEKYSATCFREFFSKDFDMVSEIFAYEFCICPRFVKREIQGFESATKVEMDFRFGALLRSSSVGFSWFQSIGLPEDHLQSCIPKLPPVIDFSCSIDNIVNQSSVSISGVRHLQTAAHFATCDVDESSLASLEANDRVNYVLLGFFRSALNQQFDCSLSWDSPNEVGFGLVQAVKGIIPSLPFEASSLNECSLFISKLEVDCFRVLVVPSIVKSSNCVFLCELMQIMRPSTDVGEKSTKITFSNTSSLSSKDGTLFIQGTSAAKKELIPKSPLSSLDMPSSCFQSWDQNWIPQIQFSYKSSLVRSLYFALLSSEKIHSADLDRGISCLRSFRITLDLTNFALLVSLSRSNTASLHLEYQQILSSNYARVSPNVHEDTPTALLFQKAEEIDSLGKKLEACANPVFISISSLTKKLDDSFIGNCIVELPLVFPGTPEFSIFPVADGRIKVELVLEVFSFVDDQLSLTDSQQRLLQTLKNDIERLTFKFILKNLLQEQKDLEFSDTLVEFVNSDIIKKTLQLPDVATDSHHFLMQTLDLIVLSSDCMNYIKEDLSRFKCKGVPFKRSLDHFYAISKEESLFWIVVEFASQKSLIIRLFSISDSKMEIIEDAIKSISLCTQRANQRFLLHELTETHTSRDSLDSAIQCHLEESRNDAVLHQLACPQVFSQWFPVHWRIKPSQALQSIISNLEPLCITNRRNFLIFSELFYMVFEHSVDGDDPLRAEPSSASLDFEALSKSAEKGITLKVYGLDAPGLEIKVNFVKLVETKIDNLVQNVVGTYISRNPAARLTKADVEFLIPPTKPPNHQSTYLLVKELENPHLFLVLLRQAFLLFLNPYAGSPIDTYLADYCLRRFGKSVTVEKEPGLVNILNVGDLIFLYNCVARKRLTNLESRVGEGLATVLLTPFDGQNSILFPSTAHVSLGSNREIILDRFQIQQTSDETVAKNWDGYKVAVTIWIRGPLHLESLVDRISLAFKFTLVDYGVESYFRSSKWYLIGKKLPVLPPSNQSSETNSTSVSLNKAKTVLTILPEILQTGAARMNPVIQSFSVASRLPLDTIAVGIRGVLIDIDMEAIFFVKDKDTGVFRALTNMLSGDYGTEYVIIGSSDIFSDPTRKMSLASDITSDSLDGQRIPRFSSLDSMESDLEKLGSRSIDGGLDEIFMFPDSFYPPFPLYGKRSSFFVVSLAEENVLVSTYNWKKLESDKFFLRVIKILNWAKINRQFVTRKDLYSTAKVAKLKATDFGTKTYRNAETEAGTLNLTKAFASRFRELDFIYHIGGYDAINLQTQIVDFLEGFFRFGSFKEKPNREAHSAQLSLQEMSQVLQSITLIHSSSSPLFFSECSGDLLAKWQNIVECQSINLESLLSLGKSIALVSPTVNTLELHREELWFQEMLSKYLETYVEYLESLGMEKASVNIPQTSHESSQLGGAFAINAKTLIPSPSIFLRKIFPGGVLLIQCGFYSFFSTVNVLSFAFSNSSDVASQSNDFLELECAKMKMHTHIVSFTYDFHLRYIQQILISDFLDLPVDISKVLRNFVGLNPRKAYFARCRIVHMHYVKDKISPELFRYILKNPSSYGFKPVLRNGIPIAITLTVESLSGRKEKSHQSDFRYSLVITEDQKSEYFSLEYFILIVNKKNVFPHLDSDNIPEIESQIDQDPLREYLDSGYYLHDVATVLEKQIESLVEKGLKDFGRDNLWMQLKDDVIPNSFEWTLLFLERISPHMRDMRDIDPGIKEILESPIDWVDMLSHLQSTFLKNSRMLKNADNDSNQYLLLFNPHNQDFLLYFRLLTSLPGDGVSCDLYSVNREGIRDPIEEHEHINDVFNTILHYLWSSN